MLFGSIAVGILFTVKVLAGKSGSAVADLLSYKRIDFYKVKHIKRLVVLYPMYMHSISNVLMAGTGYLFAILI